LFRAITDCVQPTPADTVVDAAAGTAIRTLHRERNAEPPIT
jgi:hypothetical protein